VTGPSVVASAPIRTLAAVVVALAAGMTARAEPKVAAPLEPLKFLLGEWEAGANTGPHGQGSGACAFALSLQDQVIVRTNHAEYPASGSAPALVHDDLMVIYASPAGIEAHFYDNEHHLIHYVVSVPGPGQAVFVSEAQTAAPRYRLTYELADNGALTGRFEVAPPDKPEAFARYLAWESRRAAPRR